MRIVVSGSSGLVGTALVADLEGRGHQVVRLVRRSVQPSQTSLAHWDPATGELDPAVVAGADAVINLNGRNIGDGRWTARVRTELRSSRIDTSRLIADTIRELDTPPPLLVNASAVGYYGDRGDEILDESSPPGTGFLAELSRDWEEAASAAASEHTRVVLLRLGMVVAQGGGALARMQTPFRLGLGGPIGSGNQWWPWVAIDDVLGAVRFALDEPRLSGPVNVVSPQQQRCRDFVRALGRVMRRPAVLPMPAAAARLALGEMAEALLLASARVRPGVLQDLRYEFVAPDLEDALRDATTRR